MPCEHYRPIDSLTPDAADKMAVFDGNQILRGATEEKPAATCEKEFNGVHLVTRAWVEKTCLTDGHTECPLRPPTAGSLTYHEEQPKQLEKDQWGIPGDPKRFTTDEIVQALGARTLLYLQMDPGDPKMKGKMPTCDIEVLLRTKELVKTERGFASLFVDAKKA